MKITKVQGEVQPLKVENADCREITVNDLVAAERITGRTEGWAFSAAVASQVTKFDGKNLPPEEVQRLPKKDFLDLLAELDMDAPEISGTESSISAGKESSASSAS